MDWFRDWADYHMLIFGLAADADLKTLLSWEPVFAAAGYTVELLRDATDWLLAHPECLERNDWRLTRMTAHLLALQGRIRSVLAVQYQAPELDDDRGQCVTCGGTGWVVVPHPQAIRSGQWRPQQTATGPSYYTTAAACHCPLGGWIVQRRKDAILRLRDYEQGNPGWRAQLAAHERELHEKAALGPVNSEIAELVQRLLAQARERQEALS